MIDPFRPETFEAPKGIYPDLSHNDGFPGILINRELRGTHRRLPTMIRESLILSLAITLLVPTLGIGVGAISGPTGPEVIVSEQRWEDQNRTVTSNIVVADGGTLTIENSTLDLRIEEICSPIRGSAGYCQPEIEAKEGGEIVIKNSTLFSSFENSLEWPHLRATGGNLTIEGTDLSRLSTVRAEFGGHLEFRNNHVDGWVGEVGVWRGSDGIIADSYFGNQSRGASAQDASPEIRNNTFENVSTFSVRVQQSLVGDKAYTTAPLIVDNVFKSPDQGIFTDSGAGILIAHNRFENARFQGVNVRVPTMDDEFTMLDNQPPRIEANVFVDGYRAVKAQTEARDTTELVTRLQVTGNVILNNGCDHIQTEEEAEPGAPLEVDARYNWWGSPDGPPEPERASEEPFCNAFDGSATFEISPWLTERPPNAGPRTAS